MSLRKSLLGASFGVSAVVLAAAPVVYAQIPAPKPAGAVAPAINILGTLKTDSLRTATPIKHLVIIYNENVAFDHYFGSYPQATNPSGEPAFKALPHTPEANTLITANLMTNNPNFTNTANGVNAAEPFRLDRSQASTADQNHSYTPEQEAYDGGKADLFPKYTGTATAGGAGAFGTKGQVMGYYDGNTVTALWQYAQHFAMSDNAFTDTYGPSTPGALEVVGGQTNGFEPLVDTTGSTSYFVNDTQGGHTLINDNDPAYDICSSKTNAGAINAKNIGDLLNGASIAWGGFMGGFDLGLTNANGTTGCARSTNSPIVGEVVADYVQHHNWFQYFASTSNPTHARPASLELIGYSYDHNGAADPANHQYDLQDFYAAVKAGNYPSVSYIKLPAYQDAHAGYSDPLDEQEGVVQLVNFLESQPDWKNTAVIVTYDDSDGWYDHDAATPTSSSYDATADQLDGAGVCGTGTQPKGISGKPVNGRCGPGTRIPFLVISPWANQNYVYHDRISQASVVRFIEDNWLSGERLGGGSFDATAGSIMPMFDFRAFGHAPKLFLDQTTGESEDQGKGKWH